VSVYLFQDNKVVPRYKKLLYRRGTVRCAVSVETVRNVAPMFVKLHLISSATVNDLGNGMNWYAIWYFLLVVCSNNVSILHHFFDTATLILPRTRCTWLPVRAFQYRQKSFDSIRFSLPNQFFRFNSIRQSDKLPLVHWYSNSKLGVIFIECLQCFDAVG